MRFIPIFSLAVMAACSSLVPATVATISRISPLDADPAAMDIVLVLPKGVQVQHGSAALTLASHRADTNETAAGTFILQQRALVQSGLLIPAQAQAQAFRLAPQDLVRAKTLQNRIADAKAKAPKDMEKSSISVNIVGCTVGDGPARGAVASIYLKARAGGAFLPLVRDASLAQLLGDTVFAALGPCDGAP